MSRHLGLTVALVALLGYLAVPGVAAPSSVTAQTGKSDKLVIYTTYGAPGQSITGKLVGHVFVDLTDNTHTNCRQKACRHIWGKYPGANNFFTGNGKLDTDGKRTWTWRAVYTINHDQYSQAGRMLQKGIDNPPKYNLLSDNCVDWSVAMAKAAGLTVPPYENKANISEPETLRDSLQRIGDGKVDSATKALVQKNPDPNKTADESPDPPAPRPPCCDVDAVAQVAMTDPQGLANELKLHFTKRQLAPDHLNDDGTYQVVIDKTDPKKNLYGVVWGDGATTVGERPMKVGKAAVVFSHTFQAPPANPVQVFVLEDGQLTEFDRSLNGPANGTGESSYVLEPKPGPTHNYG